MFARSKEGRIRGIYMYFPFVCDPLDTGRNTEWREIEEGKEKKKEGKKGSGREARWWTFVIDDDPPLLSAIRMAPVPATHDLEARPSPRPLL